MECYILSTFGLLLSLILTVQLKPVREKISINTDLLNKVRTPGNDTMGGRGKVHNFAWRISVTITTTTSPPSTRDPTTLSAAELEKHPEHNTIIHNQLTNTLKDPNFRKLWENLVAESYQKLIFELRQPGARKIFIKDTQDGALEGEEGEKLYTKMVNFLEAVGIKGYKILIDSVQGEIPYELTDEPEEPTTTTEPTTIRRTTISKQDIEKDPEFFQKVYIQLACTLKTKMYSDKWNEIIKAQGYMSLLEEMRKPGAHKIFMRDNGDNAWKGPEGVKLYEATVALLHTIGITGFNTLLETIESIPLSPGEKLGLTPPPPIC